MHSGSGGIGSLDRFASRSKSTLGSHCKSSQILWARLSWPGPNMVSWSPWGSPAWACTNFRRWGTACSSSSLCRRAVSRAWASWTRQSCSKSRRTWPVLHVATSILKDYFFSSLSCFASEESLLCWWSRSVESLPRDTSLTWVAVKSFVP